MKEVKYGEYALFGTNREKRIFIGKYNGKYHSVAESFTQDFKEGRNFKVISWDYMEPIIGPTYYYQYEKLEESECILTTEWMTEEYAKGHEYTELNGWYKVERGKREWSH